MTHGTKPSNAAKIASQSVLQQQITSQQDFNHYRNRFDHYAKNQLSKKTSALRANNLLAPLLDAMHYAALNGGKRIRPLLVFLSAQCINNCSSPSEKIITAENDLVDAAALAVELIHGYSLVHDDLPAMDNDALRRGQPTCHIAFGEANAILAGDALQTLAFEVLAEQSLDAATAQLKMTQRLAAAAGMAGMVGGQTIDLEAEHRSIDFEQLCTMHRLKTGALISAAVDLGAIAAHATTDQLAALKIYSEAVGLAFQIRDDVLDVEGSEADTGKTRGADIAQGKATFVSLLGVDAASHRATQLRDEAIAALQVFGEAATPLADLADFIIARNG